MYPVVGALYIAPICNELRPDLYIPITPISTSPKNQPLHRGDQYGCGKNANI